MRFPRPTHTAVVVVLGTAFLALASTQASVGKGSPAAGPCFGKKATITSNAGKVTGTRDKDVIVGGERSQRFVVGAHDIVCAGGGDDTVRGREGFEAGPLVEAGPGDDKVTWGSRVTGGHGDDVMRGADVTGGSGDDRVSGGTVGDGPGRDVARGIVVLPEDDGDPDVFIGKGGSGQLAYGRFSVHVAADDRDFSRGVSVSLDGVANDGLGCPRRCEGDNVKGFTDVFGSEGPDTLSGGDGAERLDGYTGADIVGGGGGRDRLRGGSGDDALDGGADADRCSGMSGRDTALNCERVQEVPRP